MKSVCLLISGLLCLADVQAQQSGASTADSKFVQDASAGGLAEVQLGQLAKDKSSNSAVKDFGVRMVTDHTAANDKLKSIASQANIAVASSLNSKDQALYYKLSSLSGSQFDQEYINAMVRDHREDIAEFEKEANNGQDPKIKQFAMDTLPTLRDHLKMAEDAAAQLKGVHKGE